MFQLNLNVLKEKKEVLGSLSYFLISEISGVNYFYLICKPLQIEKINIFIVFIW